MLPLVATKWDIAKAAARAPSLAKARQRVTELAARVTGRSRDADPDRPQAEPPA